MSHTEMQAFRKRINWKHILQEASKIVYSYDTGVTLRQLFYRLVSLELLPNKQTAYRVLSHESAEARRNGTFPELIDRTRIIHRYRYFENTIRARQWLANIYRRNRTEGQDVSLYLGVEKAGIIEQLELWFGDFGIPILALGGYSSQSYIHEIIKDVQVQNRPAVLIYAGDFDPSGEDIYRDFIKRTGCFKPLRIALTPEQVEYYKLPPQMGKEADPRADAFVARHGRLVQVELDALPPDILRSLYEEAIFKFLDIATYESILKIEQTERETLNVSL